MYFIYFPFFSFQLRNMYTNTKYQIQTCTVTGFGNGSVIATFETLHNVKYSFEVNKTVSRFIEVVEYSMVICHHKIGCEKLNFNETKKNT